MGAGEVKAIVDRDIADIRLHGQAVEAASSFQGKVGKIDMLVAESGQVHVKVQEIVPGIDTATESGIVKALEIRIEEVDVFVDFFKTNADSIWAKDRNTTDGQLGPNWQGPFYDESVAKAAGADMPGHNSATSCLLGAYVAVRS